MQSFAGPVTGAVDESPPPVVLPEPLVPVEALRRFVSHTGSGWNAGEVAAFPPEVAASLIARGVARAVPQLPPKAPSGPPAHKMVKGAPIKK